MQGWIDYIRSQGMRDGVHYGDWLGLEAVDSSYHGKTDPYLIASAYFYRSTEILCKAGDDMNSFNHYAYGAVADFLYGCLCGIESLEPRFVFPMGCKWCPAGSTNFEFPCNED